MYLRFKDGKDKALTLSYDDGPVFDKQLIEIMDKYGLKGTFAGRIRACRSFCAAGCNYGCR